MGTAAAAGQRGLAAQQEVGYEEAGASREERLAARETERCEQAGVKLTKPEALCGQAGVRLSRPEALCEQAGGRLVEEAAWLLAPLCLAPPCA